MCECGLGVGVRAVALCVVCFERLWQVGKIPSKSSRCKLTVV